MTNEDIEFVARAMCEALGVDPEKMVMAGDGDTDTPFERSVRDGIYSSTAFEAKQWRLCRGQAAIAIASDHALRMLRLSKCGLDGPVSDSPVINDLIKSMAEPSPLSGMAKRDDG